MKQYLYALATFSGTIIGVGLFGLPYAARQFGFLPTVFYLIILTAVTIVIHLIFGEICLRTKGKHRLPGFTEVYLGKKWKILPVITNSFGLLGANLAYIIVGGGFLANLLVPVFGGNELAFTLIFFAAGAIIIFLGSRAISQAELVSLFIFFGVMIFLFFKSLPYIQLTNLQTYELTNFILPYGIILFSLSGMSIIPEVREILGDKNRGLKNIIILGTIIPALTYLVFIFFVLGACGNSTTVDALSGLKQILGPKIITAGFIFGVLTTFTSYITIGLTLKKIFWYDLKFDHFSSWVIAAFLPIMFYLMGLNNFLAVISFIGAVTIGLDGILVFSIYRKAKKTGSLKPAYQVNLPKIVTYLIIIMFLVGVAIELVKI